jgi:hypothetical protein
MYQLKEPKRNKKQALGGASRTKKGDSSYYGLINNGTNVIAQRKFRETASHNSADTTNQQEAIQLKSYVNEAKQAVNTIRNTYGVEPGNRTEGVLKTGGTSFANVTLGRFLALSAGEGEGFWSDLGLEKKATMAYELKSANCDEFGMMAYLEMRAAGTGGSIGIEQQSGHTYGIAFDDENKDTPADQTIVDPWVKRAELRADDVYYNQKRTLSKSGKSNGAGWYMKDIYGQQMAKLNKDWKLKWESDAVLGFNLATKKKKGEDISGMY